MKVKNNWFDMLVDALCAAMLAGVTVWLWLIWPDVPQQVPTHYNALGEVDGWGGKYMVAVLLGLAWVMYVGMTAAEFFPRFWNSGVQITEENRERVYRTLKHMLKCSKLLVVSVFAFLVVSTAQAWQSLGAWFLPVFLLLTFGQTIFWMVRLHRVK